MDGLLENLTVPSASRLQNDTTKFILPVYYNTFSYFIVIPFFLRRPVVVVIIIMIMMIMMLLWSQATDKGRNYV